MLWIVFAGLAAIAVAFLLYGFFRRPPSPASRSEHDLEVYRAQLLELERERASSLISGLEAEAARIEIQRRILSADQEREEGETRPAGRSALMLFAIAASVPLVAFGLYLVLGSPEIPSVPFAGRPLQPAPTQQARNGAGAETLPDVETMLARVRARLADNPNDLAGWSIMARSLASLGQYQEAIDAFDRAIALSDGDAGLYGAKAETMIAAAQGSVTVAARAVLEQALSLDPGDPRTRFYMAGAKQQAGNTQAALDDLVALLDEAPEDASWYEVVRQRALGLVMALGQDPSAVLPEARVAVADPRTEAALLAARLEQNPKDYRGWIDLARLRIGLGDPQGARQALDLGTEAYEGAPFVLQQFRQAASDLGLSEPAGQETERGPSREDIEAASELSPDQQKEMIRTMVGGLAARLKSAPDDLQGWQMLARSYGVLGEQDKAREAYRHVLTLDATNTDALFFLGEAALARGNKEEALDIWTRLLNLLAPGSSEHTLIQERLNDL